MPITHSFFRSIFFAFVWIGGTVDLLGQSRTDDSLLQVVHENKNDNATFRAFKKIGELNEKTNARQAIFFYRQAIEFPFRTIYAKEFVGIFNSLGALYHVQGQYDSSLIEHRQALLLAQQFSFKNEIVKACRGIALNYMQQSQNDSARYYLNFALPISLQLPDQSLRASVYIDLGYCWLEETNSTEALGQFIKAAAIYEDIKDADGLGKALVNIGNIESILGQYEKALDYTTRALRISEENNSDANIAYCHRLLGRIYRKQKKYNDALREYDQAIKIYRKQGDLRNEADTFQSIGNIYFDLRQYDEALRQYKMSLSIAMTIHNPSQISYAYSGIGSAWNELKNFPKAIAYFDSSIAIARETKNRYLIMDAYEAKSSIFSNLKRYREALKFHQLYADLKDSLVQEENRQGTQEMEAKYQNEKKQDQIELLQKDQLLKNISLQQNRTIQTAMVVAFILLIVIGLLVFNRYRIIHQANRHMEIERMRNEIARDLHDDMGSTLSSIQIISQLALKENQSAPSAKYFLRIAENAAKMMESMSDMVWSINPENDSLQKMLVKMKEFSAEILEPKNINYQFQGEETLNGTVLDVAKRKNIFLIFKESINNAAKYSEGSFIEIQIANVANDLHLTIRDNGKGFDPAKTQGGNGLKNMRNRAREINAAFNLETLEGKGTILKLKLPLT